MRTALHIHAPRSRAWLSLAACALLAGCGDGTGDASIDAGPSGGCVHEYREPILVVATAEDAQTGAPLDELELWDVTLDGQALSLDALLGEWPEEDTGLERSDDDETRLSCTISCAMGTAAGAWSFTATADGYADTTVTADAQYADSGGGCPSYSDGGTRIDVTLTPE